MKRVVYRIYNPQGIHIMTYASRHQAKACLEELNRNIPSWHYDELCKYQTHVVNK